jgi:hypothetical protein
LETIRGNSNFVNAFSVGVAIFWPVGVAFPIFVTIGRLGA